VLRAKRTGRFGALAIAACLLVGLVAGPAEARKKRGGVARVATPVNLAVPDATAQFRGQLASTLQLGGKRFRKTRIRDVNVTVHTTGNIFGAASHLYALLTAPNGTTIILFSNLFGQNIGPLTLDDQTHLRLGGDLNPPLDPNVLYFPYVGTAQPDESFAPMIGGPARGTWTLRVVDRGAPPPGTLGQVSILSFWGLTVRAGPK
jgi:hypothetical protein